MCVCFFIYTSINKRNEKIYIYNAHRMYRYKLIFFTYGCHAILYLVHYRIENQNSNSTYVII